MILELINPSDAVTFAGDDIQIAGVACIFLGEGMYGFKSEQGETVVPPMLFGGADEWLKENGIDDLDAFITANRVPIAEFLETYQYGSIGDRAEFETALKMMTPDKADEYRAWWNDRKRTSLNNIGKRAASIAKALRKAATA